MAKSETKPSVKVETFDSELDMPIWSVISFERHEFSALTYRQAMEKVAELEQKKIPGLCIVTDDAAGRMTP